MNDADREHLEPSALRALAVAVVENGIFYATARTASITAADRAKARSFLLDAENPRLEAWCSVLGLDADAMREKLRERLGADDGESIEVAS